MSIFPKQFIFTKQFIFVAVALVVLVVGGILIFATGDKGAPPVAYWKFDEGSASSTYDSSGNNNTGTLYGGVQWANGVYGSGLQFDGINDYVTIPHSSSLVFGTSSFSVSLWTYRTAVGVQGGSYFRKAAGWPLDGIDTYDNALHIYTSTGKLASVGFSATIGVWEHHVFTVTQDSTPYIKHYINGVFNNTGYTENGNLGYVSSDAYALTIGYSYAGGLARYFGGSIDDFRVYNYARTADQIKNDYNDGKALYVGTRITDCDESPADCVNKGLVGYWDMDQMGGTTATDKSGNGNTGTLGGGTASARPTWTTGVQPFSGGRPGGGALSFDGVNDWVDMGKNITTSSITFSAWVKTSASVNFQTIFTNVKNNTTGNGLSFQLNSSGAVWLYYSSNDSFKLNFTTTQTVNDGRWHQVGFSWTGDTTASGANIFIDGQNVKASTSTLSDTGVRATNDIIGRMTDNNSPFYFNVFNGFIDEARMYNRVLSAAEISYQYNQAKPIAWWNFNEGSGGTIYDSSGNGYTGIASSTMATSTMWVSGVYGSALSFDEINASVEMSGLTWTPTIFSIEWWLYPKTCADWNQSLVGTSWSRFAFHADADCAVYVGTDVTTRFSPTELPANTLTLNQWQYLTYTYDGSQGRFYKNGMLLAGPKTQNTPVTWQGFRINLSNSTSTNSGFIDELKIYSYARSADQIRQGYNEGKALYVGTRITDCDESPADCVNKGLAGYWDMDQMGGQTASDKSGNGNTGTLGGGTASARPTWTTGVQPFSGGRPGGGALSFDGVNDYVAMADADNLSFVSGGMSISAWVKRDNNTRSESIVDKYQTGTGLEYVFGFYSDGLLYFWVYDNTTVVYMGRTATDFDAGVWHYVTATYNGGTTPSACKIFVDGVQVDNANFGTGASFVSMRNTSQPVSIGKTNLGLPGYFDGLIDDIRIYNRALTVAEISYQYNQAKPIAQWKMDEGADSPAGEPLTCNAMISSVYDYSGQGNTGTLYNPNASPATSSMWSDGKYNCALTFDGTDDYVALGTVKYTSIGTGDFSFSAWVKPASFNTTNYNYITDNAGTNRWIIGSTDVAGAIKIYSLNAGSWTTTALATTSVGVWSHLEIVRRSGVVYGYLNGVYQASANFNYSISHTGVSTIGSHNAGTAAFWSGSIDDARMYSYARTADQIRADYNAGAGLHLGN